MGRSIGQVLVMAGIASIVIGTLVWVCGLSWFGRFPGDIRIDRGNVQIYIPVISMLLISIAATILLFRLAVRVSPVTVGVPCAERDHPSRFW
jgi:Protein of unknown function (DUF2905)